MVSLYYFIQLPNTLVDYRLIENCIASSFYMVCRSGEDVGCGKQWSSLRHGKLRGEQCGWDVIQCGGPAYCAAPRRWEGDGVVVVRASQWHWRLRATELASRKYRPCLLEYLAIIELSWNQFGADSLPSEVTLSEYLSSFKTKLNAHLFAPLSHTWHKVTEELGIFSFKF